MMEKTLIDYYGKWEHILEFTIKAGSLDCGDRFEFKFHDHILN